MYSRRYERFILENREYFSRIPRSAVDVIDVFTNIKDIRECLQYTLNQESGEEETNMCKALEDIKRREMKQGVRLGTLETLYSLVNDGLLKLEEAADRANLSKEAFRKGMRQAGYPKR